MSKRVEANFSLHGPRVRLVFLRQSGFRTHLGDCGRHCLLFYPGLEDVEIAEG